MLTIISNKDDQLSFKTLYRKHPSDNISGTIKNFVKKNKPSGTKAYFYCIINWILFFDELFLGSTLDIININYIHSVNQGMYINLIIQNNT